MANHRQATTRIILCMLCVPLTASMSGCAVYGYQDTPRFAGDYDIFYDGFYGDITDGYWSDDGWFYYRDAKGQGFHRDDARHVRRDAAQGYHSAHVHHDRSSRQER